MYAGGISRGVQLTADINLNSNGRNSFARKQSKNKSFDYPTINASISRKNITS